MLLWKAAGKSDPPDVQLTEHGWGVKEHEHVMPAISREPDALSTWTSSGAAAKRRAKSVVEGVDMDPMECRVPATSVCEGCCNPHTQREEDEGDSQQSEVDYD